MKIEDHYKTCGYFVLVEILKATNKSKGGIILTGMDVAKENAARDFGRVLQFGPTAFKGIKNANTPDDWGVKVGDYVEFKMFDGKNSVTSKIIDEGKNYKLINDTDILGVISEDMVKMLVNDSND